MISRRWLLVICLFLAGCASAPPPAPVSPLRQQAQRAEDRGRAAYAKRNWNSAADSFAKAAEIYGALDDFSAQAGALHNQAQAEREAGQVDVAIKLFEESLRLAEKPETIAGLAQAYRAKGDLDAAIDTAGRALTLAEAQKSKSLLTIQNDLAVLLFQRGNPGDQSRVVSLLSAVAGARDEHVAATGELNLGRAYLSFGELDAAEKQLQSALEKFRALDDPRGLAEAHESLANLFTARNDSERAALHHRLAQEKFQFLGIAPP